MRARFASSQQRSTVAGHDSFLPVVRAGQSLSWRIPVGLDRISGTRGVFAFAARGGAVVLIGLAAYVGVQVWLRTEWRQKRSIRRRLCAVEDIGLGPGSTRPGDGSTLWLDRPERLAFLQSCIEGTPSGPLVVTGPEGSGKSSLLRQAIANRPLCWFLNLREIPVTTGDQLFETFVTRAGYLPPPDELLGQVVFARTSSDATKRRTEKDKALRFITDVLRDVQRHQVADAAASSSAAATAAAVAAASQPASATDAALGSRGGVATEHAFASTTGVPSHPHIKHGIAEHVSHTGTRTSAPPRDSVPAGVGTATSRSAAAAATVVEALGRARAERATSVGGSSSGPAPAAEAERLRRVSMGGLGLVGRTVVDAVRRLSAIAPPWAQAVTEALQAGVLATFAVELEGNSVASAMPSHLAPLICLDELNVLTDADDPQLHALLDWMQYLTDERLAHVALTCSADFAEQLDKHRSFRQRRQRIHVDFPRAISVREFLEGAVNTELQRRARAAQAAVSLTSPPAALAASNSGSMGLAGEPARSPHDLHAAFPTRPEAESGTGTGDVEILAQLDDADVDWLTSMPPEDLPAAARLRRLTAEEVHIVAETVGGHMKDLDAVVRQLLEGHALASVMQRSVADCVDSVESYIEMSLLRGHPLLPVGSPPPSPGSSPGIRGSGAAATGASGSGADGKSVARASPPTDAAELTARAWRFLRMWRLMQQLSRRKYVSRRELTTELYAGHAWELDELTAHGLIMCANLRSTRKLRPHSSGTRQQAGETAPHPAHQGGTGQHHAAAERPMTDTFAAATRYVSAASPRLRASFRVITNNAALCAQAERVQAFLQAGILRQQLAEVKQQLATTGSERDYYAKRVEHLAEAGTKPWAGPEREAELQKELAGLEARAKAMHDRAETLQQELEAAEKVADGATRVTMQMPQPAAAAKEQAGSMPP